MAVQAVDTSTEAEDVGAHTLNHSAYSAKLSPYKKAERLQTKSDAANVEAIYQQRMAEHPEDFSNPISCMQQRKGIQKEYAAANARSAAKEGATATKPIGQRLSELKDKLFECVAEHPHVVLIAGGLVMIVMIVSSSLSSLLGLSSGRVRCGSGLDLHSRG